VRPWLVTRPNNPALACFGRQLESLRCKKKRKRNQATFFNKFNSACQRLRMVFLFFVGTHPPRQAFFLTRWPAPRKDCAAIHFPNGRAKPFHSSLPQGDRDALFAACLPPPIPRYCSKERGLRKVLGIAAGTKTASATGGACRGLGLVGPAFTLALRALRREDLATPDGINGRRPISNPFYRN